MRSYGAKLAALRSLALALVFAAGCGGGEDEARPAPGTAPSGGQTPKAPGDQASANRSSPSRPRPLRGSAREGIRISQPSGPGVAQASGSLPPRDEGGGSISSNGVATLSFEVERPSRLVWTNSGSGPFVARGSGVAIDSRQGRGEADLKPGIYDDFYVRGAAWKIVVRPR